MENGTSYYVDHEYDEDYFTFDVEKQYIKETNKMPYYKGDKNLSKHFKAWIQKRWSKERAEIDDTEWDSKDVQIAILFLQEKQELETSAPENVWENTIKKI